MVRPTARFLVLVMLLASGRLLACGWECADELAVPVAASCHEDLPTDREGLAIVALANVGDTMHACLPDVAEPRVTLAKPATAHGLAAAPLSAPHLAPAPSSEQRHRFAALSRSRPESPHLSAPPILRV